MSILSGFRGVTAGLGMGAKRQKFPATLQASDFSSTTTTLSTTDYIKVGTYTVPAQQQVNVGYGNSTAPQNQGYLYVVSKDSSGAAEEGMLRLVVANATESRSVKVFEERTNVLSGSATAKESKVPLPERDVRSEFGRIPSEDDLIQIWILGDAAGIWSPTLSTVYVPITRYQ